MLKSYLKEFKFYAIGNTALSFVLFFCFIMGFGTGSDWMSGGYILGVFLGLAMPFFAVFAYFRFCSWAKENITQTTVPFLAIVALLTTASVYAWILISGGSITSIGYYLSALLTFPFFALFLVMLEIGFGHYYFSLVIGILLLECVTFIGMRIGHRDKKLKPVSVLVYCLVLFSLIFGIQNTSYDKTYEIDFFQSKSDEEPDYIRVNYSLATDLSDYFLYNTDNKLATLDHKITTVNSSGNKENDIPTMDGSEAVYPLYAALAKACYPAVEKMERQYRKDEMDDLGNLMNNGKYVCCTNPENAFSRLLDDEVQIYFGMKLSEEQYALAKTASVKLSEIEIAREAFVFYTEPDNPVDNLTKEQVYAIFAGQITNWFQVGGKNAPILTYEHMKGEEAYTAMKHFMSVNGIVNSDSKGEEPENMKKEDSFQSEEKAIGYSFRCFREELYGEDVKILSIDGVEPTPENIENGTYPLSVSVYAVYKESDESPDITGMIDFCLSEDGQELVRKAGFAGL